MTGLFLFVCAILIVGVLVCFLSNFFIEEGGVGILGMTSLLVLFFLVSLEVSKTVTSHQTLIEKGLGHYVVNSTNGTVEFVFFVDQPKE
jgi:hypothetical protein